MAFGPCKAATGDSVFAVCLHTVQVPPIPWSTSQKSFELTLGRASDPYGVDRDPCPAPVSAGAGNGFVPPKEIAGLGAIRVSAQLPRSMNVNPLGLGRAPAGFFVHFASVLRCRRGKAFRGAVRTVHFPPQHSV